MTAKPAEWGNLEESNSIQGSVNHPRTKDQFDEKHIQLPFT